MTLVADPEFICRVCKVAVRPIASGGICPACCGKSEKGHDFSERNWGRLWCAYCGQPADDRHAADRAATVST
jgi:predicted amidophosphoribosyltransferase